MTGLEESIGRASDGSAAKTLITLLTGVTTPAFGALSKREMELLIFEALIDVGYISNEPPVYDIVQKLRVTRSKARSLLYDRSLRLHSTDRLDEMARTALSRPVFQANGGLVALDIENPLLADHLRHRLKELGHTSDGSFSPDLVKLSYAAAAELIAHYVPKDSAAKIRAELGNVLGMPDTSLKGLVKAILMKAAGRVAADSGAELAGLLTESFAGIMTGGVDSLRILLPRLFGTPGTAEAAARTKSAPRRRTAMR